ncbi:hypothetical protein [Methanoregula sp.]|uniref:hypothetical protein n=2 Tax=Methanoregula sp. TaxID=2052170 RepID=UPI003BB022EB
MVSGYRNWNKIRSSVAAIGIICIVIMGIFLSGCIMGQPGSGSGTSPAQSGTSQAAGQPAQSAAASVHAEPGSHVTLFNSSSGDYPYPVQAQVPASGVYLRAGYLGQYTGSYTANGVSQEVKSSGFRLFDLGQPTGTVSAVFEKADDAVKHNLTVEIWENGRLLASNGTNAAYGTVSVSANV